jgi:hypothetical protein
MEFLGGVLGGLLISVIFAPRRSGRLLAKIVIGFRAQMRDEGEA